jgi:hypothetical protein
LAIEIAPVGLRPQNSVAEFSLRERVTLRCGRCEGRRRMAAYGTMFRVRLRAETSEETLRGHLERWQRELGPRFPGSVRDLLLKVDGDEREYVVLHLFASREAYGAMAGDAAQDRWYQELVTLLDAPPQFTDVELRWSADLSP